MNDKKSETTFISDDRSVNVTTTTVPPGNITNTGYAQGFNAGNIDAAAGMTNVDHCPRDTMSQQYCDGLNAVYAKG